jgi:ABC-type branched-subunit amino acid transport system substrate-binding protein
MRRALLVFPVLVLIPALAAAGNLSEAERRGQRIYLEGQGRGSITARLVGPGLTAPGSAFPCASCHLDEGPGVREGGVRAADITHATLTKEFPGVRPSGRAHGPYTDETLKRAVTAGRDPGGNLLHEAHPHYVMNAEDLEDLVAYLKVLGQEPVPGVSDTEIRVGILLPDGGPLEAAATAVRDLLQVYFEELNDQGGVYRRKLRLVPARFDPLRPASAAAAARDLIDGQDVLCLLANLGVPPEDEGLALLAAANVPVIAPLQIAVRPPDGADDHTFHIYATVDDQARVMVDFVAAATEGSLARVAILHATDRIGTAGAAGARQQADKHGLMVVVEVPFAAGRLPAAESVRLLREARTDTVLFFGPGTDAVAFLHEAEREQWRPPFLAPAPMVGATVLSTASELTRTVFLSSPVAILDVQSRDAAPFLALLAKFGTPGEYSSFHVAAYAGAKLLEEALRRSGREVTRHRLVQALGSLWAFPTGVTPLLTYGRSRRVGALGAQILTIDVERQGLIVAAPWREPQ